MGVGTGLGEGVGEGVGLGLGVGLGDGVGEGVGDGVVVGDERGETDGVDVGRTATLGEDDGVGVDDGGRKTTNATITTMAAMANTAAPRLTPGSPGAGRRSRSAPERTISSAARISGPGSRSSATWATRSRSRRCASATPAPGWVPSRVRKSRPWPAHRSSSARTCSTFRSTSAAWRAAMEPIETWSS